MEWLRCSLSPGDTHLVGSHCDSLADFLADYVQSDERIGRAIFVRLLHTFAETN